MVTSKHIGMQRYPAGGQASLEALPAIADLITDLSDQEQETVAGGFGMVSFTFFRNTSIRTFGSQNLSVGGINGGNPFQGNSASSTGYELNQTTYVNISFPAALFTGYGASRGSTFGGMSPRFFAFLPGLLGQF